MQFSCNHVWVLAAILGSSFALPIERIETDPELTAGYFEGDMVLRTNLRNGLLNKVYRWPNNTVYYEFVTPIGEPEKNHISLAMQYLEQLSCIIFKKATADNKNFIGITGDDKGCYSDVGYLNNGSQVFNLKPNTLDVGCFRLGTIVHELLHTLGFFHMQSASNRDEYVRVVEENIQEGKAYNFKKYNEYTVSHFGEEYDYASVMHYPAYAFSANGKMTLEPLKDKNAVNIMGQREGMTQRDINKLNAMYNCPKQSEN